MQHDLISYGRGYQLLFQFSAVAVDFVIGGNVYFQEVRL